MDSEKPRRGRPRSASAEAAVLDAAYRLIAGKGLAATTIDAIARASKVSKMTIYKWWPSREALLVDAFLRHASQMLRLVDDDGDARRTIRRHAAAYSQALVGQFGAVQLAVISDCIARTGSAALFAERYLAVRRGIGTAIIERGQREGTITQASAAGDLYDRIYGTLFYRYVFRLRPLSAAYARQLVESLLAPGALPRRRQRQATGTTRR